MGSLRRVDRKGAPLQNHRDMGPPATNSQGHAMERKKILLMAHDVTLAHLGRPLQLATDLLAQGHDVILAASDNSTPFLQSFRGRRHTLASTGKAKFIENLASGKPVFDFAALKRFAEEDEAVLSTFRPDLVIGDFRLSLSVSARRQHVPFATITNAYWSPAFSPRFIVPDLPMVKYLGVGLSQILFDLARPLAFAYHCRPLNALRQHYGLPSLGHDLRRIYTDADLVLFSDIPELYASSANDTPSGQFLGPIQWSPDLPLPDWWDELDPTLPTAYVTLGSSGDGALLPRLIDALRPTGLQLMVATAGAAGIETGGSLFCADYLPGDAAASRAALVICNGGSPTSSQALAHGVPVLGLPGNLDQFLNMHFLEKWGVAASLRKANLSSRAVCAATEHLLRSPDVRASAARLATVFARHSSALLIAPALAQLL